MCTYRFRVRVRVNPNPNPNPNPYEGHAVCAVCTGSISWTLTLTWTLHVTVIFGNNAKLSIKWWCVFQLNSSMPKSYAVAILLLPVAYRWLVLSRHFCRNTIQERNGEITHNEPNARNTWQGFDNLWLIDFYIHSGLCGTSLVPITHVHTSILSKVVTWGRSAKLNSGSTMW